MTREDIKNIFQDIGPRVSRIQEVREQEQGTWGIVLADDDGRDAVALQLFLRESEGKLVFTAPLGSVTEARKAETCAFMLTYNFLWTNTGGLRVAMDMDGNMMLAGDVALSGLNSQKLSQILEAFTARALIFQMVMADGGIASKKQADDLFLESYAIRV